MPHYSDLLLISSVTAVYSKNSNTHNNTLVVCHSGAMMTVVHSITAGGSIVKDP